MGARVYGAGARVYGVGARVFGSHGSPFGLDFGTSDLGEKKILLPPEMA